MCLPCVRSLGESGPLALTLHRAVGLALVNGTWVTKGVASTPLTRAHHVPFTSVSEVSGESGFTLALLTDRLYVRGPRDLLLGSTHLLD